LKTIPADAERRWGKMNVQQMIEHMSDSVRMANGKFVNPLVTPEENVPKMQAFLMSEKPFRENTPNNLLSETPLPPRNTTMNETIEELQNEIDDFFLFFKDDKNKTFLNPFFGQLNFDMWVQLLHKHAMHHLRQFGVNP
jgi:hypothetical protein